MRLSICSSRKSVVDEAPAAVGPKLGERREQLLGGLRGAMSISESVQSVGHYFEFVFQCVDRRASSARNGSLPCVAIKSHGSTPSGKIRIRKSI